MITNSDVSSLSFELERICGVMVSEASSQIHPQGTEFELAIDRGGVCCDKMSAISIPWR